MSRAQSPDDTPVADPAEPEMSRMHFTAEVDGEEFAPLLAGLAKITAQARMHFTPDSIQFNVIDTAHIALAQVEYPNVEYKNDLDETVTVGVDLSELASECRTFRYDEQLAFRLDRDEDEMKVLKNGTMDWVSLYDPEGIRDEPDISVTEFDTEAHIEVVDLKSVIGSVSGGPENATTIEIGEDGLRTKAPMRGRDDYPSASVACPTEGPKATTHIETDLLWNVVGSFFPSGEVHVRTQDEYPLEIETKYGLYQMAPRFSEDWT